MKRPWDSFFWPGSTTLVNKLGIHDEDKLAEAEYKIVRHRSHQLFADPSRITAETPYGHLKQIHAHMFGDLYDWAGEPREFGMSKQTSAFALPHKMSEHFDFGARQLKTRSWRDTMLGRHKAVHDLSQAFGHLNHAHPFREGNGRSTRIFLRLELRRHGLDLDSSAVTSHEWNKASALTEPKMGRYGIDVSADLMRGIFSKMLTKQQPVQALTEAQIQRVVDGFTIQPERSASRYDWPSIIEKYEDSPADWQPEL